ncbi:5-oxoprolinase [Minwuia thermotolerans]|uniref:5-oxoprolinase n=1 Tax=Minwuia thermotolerans TaxID=2056226 RepID=A0A2M9FY49_9PROT|nr:5-oxoprolinase [Minwuia thermotolerans]
MRGGRTGLKDNSIRPPWRIGVDVGGTFTDMALVDAAGALRVFKSPSVPSDPAAGVIGVLEHAAGELGGPLGELLAGCRLFVHGSTIATNTILERKGARIGMIVSDGLRDALEIRRGFRADQWDHRAPNPPVLAPRFLRRPVKARLDKDGRIDTPLDEDDVRAAAEVFAREGVESVAVCLHNAYADGVQERRVAELLADRWSGERMSLSHVVNPVVGEYERGSTVAMNAYVAPKVVGYLQRLNDRLLDLGLPNPILLVQSNGGVVSVREAAERPVNLTLSGPAAGVGALKLYRQLTGLDDLVAMEIGGTSCDVTLMAGGEAPVSDQLEIDGYHLATPAIDIHTVGAGGGTLAGVDNGGMLRVGPEGAGADPGPAAYGKGNDRPTATDAHLALGRLRPGPMGGGAVSLDPDRARLAIETHVAKPLGLSIEDAAIGILRLLEQNLLHAVERLSVERGYDPKAFTLVAAGGAGPMHGAAVARTLGCRRVFAPQQAGAFCALGMLWSDVRLDSLRVMDGDLDATPDAELEAGFAPLLEEGRAALAREGFEGAAADLQRVLDLRYKGQQWSLRTAIDGFDRAAIRRAFEADHARRFGHIQPGGTILITALRLVATGRIDRQPPAPAKVASGKPPEPTDRRRCFVDARTGWRDVPVYRAEDMTPGSTIEGPLIVEAPTTTILAGDGDRVSVDAHGHYMIEIGENR